MSAALENSPPLLRLMRENDLARVSMIEQRSYDFPWSVGVFADCLRVGYCCWTIGNEHEMAGYGIMSVVAQECHILNICVDPNFRRQGFAGLLLQQLLESADAHGATMAYLEVRPSNFAALDLYIEKGFAQIGQRPDYYPAQVGREDALVLSKEITAMTPPK